MEKGPEGTETQENSEFKLLDCSEKDREKILT